MSTVRAFVALLLLMAAAPAVAAGDDGSSGCIGVIERPTTGPAGLIVDGTAAGVSTGSKSYVVVVSPANCIPNGSSIFSLSGMMPPDALP